MLERLTLNKETGVAIVKISGKGFHKNLHQLCTVVHKEDRKFDGVHWHIANAREYAKAFHEWWPAFSKAVEAQEAQLELPLG
jgi:hypothetical protein